MDFLHLIVYKKSGQLMGTPILPKTIVWSWSPRLSGIGYFFCSLSWCSSARGCKQFCNLLVNYFRSIHVIHSSIDYSIFGNLFNDYIATISSKQEISNAIDRWYAKRSHGRSQNSHGGKFTIFLPYFPEQVFPLVNGKCIT